MKFDVESHTVYLVRHGSVCYGTNKPESDVDVKGAAIAPLKFYLGLSHFEQKEEQVNKGHEQDKSIYDIQKFIRLAANGNPNILECLFVDDVDVLRVDAPGLRLRQSRDLFLSKKIRKSMAGFAHQQIKRIKPEQYPNSKMCKHAYHLVRLMRMAKEVLSGEGMIVKRIHDRDELLAIRRGAWTYSYLQGWFKEHDEMLDELCDKSTLQEEPDMEKIDDLCVSLIREFHGV